MAAVVLMSMFVLVFPRVAFVIFGVFAGLAGERKGSPVDVTCHILSAEPYTYSSEIFDQQGVCP